MRYTLETWIEKNGREGWQYVGPYVNAHTEIEVICPEGHSVMQKPNKHQQGRGCKVCSGRSGRTHDEWLAKYGREGWDYSRAVYENYYSMLDLTCPNGHRIEQSVASHSMGSGCPDCVGKPAYDLDKWVAKFGRPGWEYLSEYVNNHTDILMRCPEGHELWIKPALHAKGKGCRKCASRHNYTTEEWIAEHGREGWDYSITEYVNYSTPIKCICPEGHEVEVIVQTHVLGCGCPKCPREGAGFQDALPGMLYYLRVEYNGLTLYKVGITNHGIESRFPKQDLAKITVLNTETFEVGLDARLKETRYKKEYARYQYQGDDVLASGGNTELFTIDILGLDREAA